MSAAATMAPSELATFRMELISEPLVVRIAAIMSSTVAGNRTMETPDGAEKLAMKDSVAAASSSGAWEETLCRLEA